MARRRDWRDGARSDGALGIIGDDGVPDLLQQGECIEWGAGQIRRGLGERIMLKYTKGGGDTHRQTRVAIAGGRNDELRLTQMRNESAHTSSVGTGCFANQRSRIEPVKFRQHERRG
jgi:hypothetical protein